MATRIVIKYNRDAIQSAQLSVLGGSGDSCLVATKALRDLNPNAEIKYGEEFYDDETTRTGSGTVAVGSQDE